MTTDTPPDADLDDEYTTENDDDRTSDPDDLSVAEAARSGSRRALMVAIRDRIAEAVTSSDCPPRDLASLTKRLQDTANEIEAIDARSAEDAESDPGRIRELEAALRAVAPGHPLLTGSVDDRFDASTL